MAKEGRIAKVYRLHQEGGSVKEIAKRMKRKKELEILANVLPSVVTWKKVENGIEIASVNQPTLSRTVELPPSTRDLVWDWLKNPRIVSRESWKTIRKPVMSVILQINEIIIRHGTPLHREVIKKFLQEERAKSRKRNRQNPSEPRARLGPQGVF